MSNSVKFSRLARLSFGALLVSSSVFAAGFEKSLTWSAKSAAQGGAVVGSTSGAEALYFNPAGLVNSSMNGELSANFSPTFSQFQGVNPFSTAGSIKGKTGFSPVFGLLASFKPTPKLGVGIGYYVSGGTKSKYEGLDYSGYNANFSALQPTIETSLAITEAALGVGYELIPGLKIGLAWRVVMVKADFSTAIVSGTNFLRETDINNISATRWNAFKAGMQYEEPAHRWGLGAAFRSGVDFTATGDETTKTINLPTPGAVVVTQDAGKSHVSNSFPYQIELGGWTRATELLRIGYEYSYTNYNKDKGLVIENGLSNPPVQVIDQNWKNMHIGRIGGEYTGFALPVRFGYTYTSAVTPTDRARSTFSSPGAGHAIAAGTGMILGNNIDVDGALEYSFASGTGHNVSGEVPADDSFKSHAYVAHISAKYHF